MASLLNTALFGANIALAAVNHDIHAALGWLVCLLLALRLTRRATP